MFLISFSSTFLTLCCHTPTLWLLHLKITIILAITPQITIILAITSKFTTVLDITPQITIIWLFHLKILILPHCIKFNIDTNRHVRHFSCKS